MSTFRPRIQRHLSYISEGLEEDDEDDTTAADSHHYESNRVSASMRSHSALDTVQESDDGTKASSRGSVSSSSGGGASLTVTSSRVGSRGRSSSSGRPSHLSSSCTSHSSTLRSSVHSSSSGSSVASDSSFSTSFKSQKIDATDSGEINIHTTPYFEDVDETLPREYSDASLYEHELIFPPKDYQEETTPYPPSVAGNDYRMLASEQLHEPSKLSYTQRRGYTVLTIGAAISLSLAGIVFAAQVLSTSSSLSTATTSTNYNAEYFYLPRYEFGGGSGGMSKSRDDVVRRVENAEYFPDKSVGPNVHLSSSSSSSSVDSPKIIPLRQANFNPDHVKLVPNGGARSSLSPLRSSLRNTPDGYGTRQFNPVYNTHRPLEKATLTSVPLASYTPPERDTSTNNIVMDPMFHGAMMDVSILPFRSENELPVFWDVPMTGIQRFQYVLGHCLRLVQCTDAGRELLMREFQDGGEDTTSVVTAASDEARREEGPTLTLVPIDTFERTFDPPLKTEYFHSSAFVNVDCSTSHGIDRGISHDLSTSNMIDVVYSPDLYDVARLFAPPTNAYGRGVVMMRHPVERVVALYEYLRLMDGSMSVGTMSLEEFAKSDLIVDNLLVRSLSKNRYSILQDADYELAKEVLKRKFIIGLYENISESLERIQLFFGWNVVDNDARSCRESELQKEGLAHYNRYSKDAGNGDTMHPGLTDGALEAIMSKNKIDLMLFDYSKFLFDYQGRVLFEVR